MFLRYGSLELRIRWKYFTEKLSLKDKAEVERYLRYYYHHCQTNQGAKKHFLNGLDQLSEKRAYRRAIKRYGLVDTIGWIKHSLNSKP